MHQLEDIAKLWVMELGRSAQTLSASYSERSLHLSGVPEVIAWAERQWRRADWTRQVGKQMGGMHVKQSIISISQSVTRQGRLIRMCIILRPKGSALRNHLVLVGSGVTWVLDHRGSVVGQEASLGLM